MFVKNPFNYTASKDRILTDIANNMDYTKDVFVDLFCGSGVVGVNLAKSYEKVILNDGCKQMVELLQYMINNSTEDMLREIFNYIGKFNLSKGNKEGYLTAREVYNNGKRNPMLLYCLIAHSFSYNVVFNKDGGFSVPSGAGRSYFNPSMKNKFKAFCEELHEQKDKFILSSEKISKDANLNICHYDVSECMIYADPPYLTSDGACSRSYGLRWTKEHDKVLMDYLDIIDEHGGSFAMSNAFYNNGYENVELQKWAEKYKVHHLSCDYHNCHHQRKNIGKTDEVLITNY